MAKQDFKLNLDFRARALGSSDNSFKEEDDTVAIMLSKALGYNNKGDAIKQSLWAIKLSENGSLTLDEVDKEAMITFVKSTEMLANIIKYTIHEVLKGDEATLKIPDSGKHKPDASTPEREK
jgi:hypothetical protein